MTGAPGERANGNVRHTLSDLDALSSEKRTLLLVNERLPVLPLRGGLAK